MKGRVSCQSYHIVSVKEIRDIIPEFEMIPVFGFYLIKDLKMEVNDMYDNANACNKDLQRKLYSQNYAFYQDEMSQDLIQEQRIVNMTRVTLQEEFVLFLQPKYDIQEGKFAGAEVLVRWKASDQKMISPGEFIPIFERDDDLLLNWIFMCGSMRVNCCVAGWRKGMIRCRFL